MTTIPVHLPGPVALIPSQPFLAYIGNQLSPLVNDLNTLARRGVLPARVQDHHSGRRILLHAQTVELPPLGARSNQRQKVFRQPSARVFQSENLSGNGVNDLGRVATKRGVPPFEHGRGPELRRARPIYRIGWRAAPRQHSDCETPTQCTPAPERRWFVCRRR